MRGSRAVAVALAIAAPALAAAKGTRASGSKPADARDGRMAAASAPSAPAERSIRRAFCSGLYADDLSALSSAARALEQRQAPYTYCVRTTAVYECPSYGRDGSLRVDRKKVVAHGTAFGLRQEGGSTLFVTNQHVAEWPAVTDEDHVVEGVPGGCKRVSDALKIVENESDAYERDDVPLTRVVNDTALDVAVLRARTTLPVIPWKIGRSAALQERNVVDVRGFPLGVLRATNVGKVVSAHEHDEDRDWDHEDFVVDALLSPGNSGSPVLAISCRTGEFELVGIYHAGYVRGSALNVVVGIDQVRDLLSTLKSSARRRDDSNVRLEAKDRDELVAGSRAAAEPFFPFGNLSAAVRARSDGALVFEVMGRDFPVVANPILVLEDLPGRSGSEFGDIGNLWAGNRQGLVKVDRASLDAESRSLVTRLVDALRREALLAMRYRSMARLGMISRAQFRGVTRLEHDLRRSSGARADLAQSALDLADRLCPGTVDARVSLADVLLAPRPPARPGAARRAKQPASWRLADPAAHPAAASSSSLRP